ncbi:TrkH family potassium uptake protein [Paenirhodobacter hankyongi]|uniref:Trk system potassium uptake protein n=1 Tax=Paenirhodobacter hankyongi TaxID=2294033 RepID=A0A421BT75_9RHOB|nr:TrkH family potassium uptake protein [Sinirhodobacter hankyongi]RLL71506.1 TrkH family potassium uptake protein [Sinirhodobacter hankyongi]
MTDFGPVFHHLGLILLALGVAMLAPVGVDLLGAEPNGLQVLKAAIETTLFGALLALATRSDKPHAMTLRQAYLLTAAIWIFVPFFGALPFLHGKPDVSLTDAYFEAVSGITTTGYTVFTGIEDLPRSVLLWRGMLNWMGGLGIAFVAMIFLPVMRIGGMRYFQTEGFDTFGKVLPRARDIAISLLEVYTGLTVLCTVVFVLCGMPLFDASIHAMAAIATGGFGTFDANFAVWSVPAQYAGTVFMLLGAMPYIRFFQLVQGQSRPLWHDSQVRAFLRWFVYFSAIVIAFRLWREDLPFEQVLRETTFNFASILTGTGFGVGPIEPWGTFAMVIAFLLGLIGGCTGSSSGALSVFRVQVVLSVVRAAIRQLHSPHRVIQPRYDGKPLDEETLGPLMLHVSGYILTLGVLSVLMSMAGADFTSSLFAIWGCLGDIGFGVGPMVARTGTMVDFNDIETLTMCLAMLLGRLGMLAIFVLFLPRFWRD